jgi:cytochrome c553
MAHKALLPLIVAAFLGSILPARSQTPLPEGPGKQLVETSCVQCHELSSVTRRL